jgi:hypothetical protein
MIPLPDAIAETEVVSLGGSPPSVLISLGYDKRSSRLNGLALAAQELLEANGALASGVSAAALAPHYERPPLLVRMGNVATTSTIQGLTEPAILESFVVDRAQLAGPITVTLDAESYVAPRDRLVSVSITGTGADVTLDVPGVGTTIHGGVAPIARTFGRLASGWEELAP